jgi:hypothetical protein
MMLYLLYAWYLVHASYSIFIENIIKFFNTEIHTSDGHDNELVTREPNMAAAFHHASDMHVFFPVTSSPTSDMHSFHH